MLSAMFSHDPPNGVYSGMTPWANSHNTNSGVLWPARLSSTKSIRKGGGRCASVGLTVSPCCQRSHDSRNALASGATTAGAGSPPRMAVSSCLSQPCRTSLGQPVTPLSWTRPSEGWNKVSTLAVPLRMYSCGCRAGSPCGCQLWPGYGAVWNGPAWSQHQTDKPNGSPSA